jgi:hypothetical protein
MFNDSGTANNFNTLEGFCGFSVFSSARFSWILNLTFLDSGSSI